MKFNVFLICLFFSTSVAVASDNLHHCDLSTDTTLEDISDDYDDEISKQEMVESNDFSSDTWPTCCTVSSSIGSDNSSSSTGLEGNSSYHSLGGHNFSYGRR